MENAERNATRRTDVCFNGWQRFNSILPNAQAHHIIARMTFRLRQIVRYFPERGGGGDREVRVARGSEENWDRMLGRMRNAEFRRGVE